MISISRCRNIVTSSRLTLYRPDSATVRTLKLLQPRQQSTYLRRSSLTVTVYYTEQQTNALVLTQSIRRRLLCWPIKPFNCGLSTHNSNNAGGVTNDTQTVAAPVPKFTGTEIDVKVPSSLAEEKPQLVYESPLGNVVSKLRTVSLTTAIIGMTGVPCMIAIKGGVIPEVGILAAAMLFVTGSIGSTAAIHFVFAPYVYRIECIPIRQCSIDASATSSDVLPSSQKDTLLKAWTRSLFLRDSTIVFDPCIDVQPYKGMRPMCNLLAKGRPLYVHPGTFYRWTVSFQVFIS
jgi:hypothetical protein